MPSRIARSLCAAALTLTAAAAPADEPAASARQRPSASPFRWLHTDPFADFFREDCSSSASPCVGAVFTTGRTVADPPASHTPPAPEAQTPAVPPCRASGHCQLLSSDAFADGADPETLPQCRPLPELNAAPVDCAKNEPTRLELFAKTLFLKQAPRTCADSQPNGSFTLTLGARARCQSNQTAAAELTSNQPAPQYAPTVPADSLTPLQHLQKAADHLEAAGRHDDATRIRQQAEVMRKHAHHRLQELRQQQQQIHREIEQLERMTGASEQIKLKVSMLEIDEAKLARYSEDNELPEDFVLQAGGWASLPSDRAREQLNQLRKAGVVKVLAEPTLIMRNGQEASIHTGGEFPILVPQQDGNVTIQYRECGVRMTAKPTLLGGNRLRLHLQPQLSERDFTNSTDVQGLRIPGVTSRCLNSQVEMSFGETVVIGGLRSHRPQAPLVYRSPNLPDHLSNYLIQLTGGQLAAAENSPAATPTGTSFVVIATPTLHNPTPHAATHTPASGENQPPDIFNIR